MTQREAAVVVASFDGFETELGGVGVVIGTFLEAYSEIASAVWEGKVPPLVLISPHLAETSPDYRSFLAQRTSSVVRRSGGNWQKIYHKRNAESLFDVIGNDTEPYMSEAVEEYSLRAAEIIRSVSTDFRTVIVLAHTLFFSQLRKFDLGHSNVRVVFIPHKLAAFCDDHLKDVRTRLEAECAASLVDGDKLGAVAPWVGEVLKRDYNIGDDQILDLKNGIYVNAERYSGGAQYAEEILDRCQVAQDKHVIFYFGRFSELKRVDALLEAWIVANKKCSQVADQYHLLMLAPVAGDDPHWRDATLRKYASQLERISNSYTLLDEHDSFLPAAMLRSRRTLAAVFPSKHELFSIAAIEAALLRKYCEIWHTDIPSFQFFKRLSSTALFETADDLAELIIGRVEQTVVMLEQIPDKDLGQELGFAQIYSRAFKRLLMGG